MHKWFSTETPTRRTSSVLAGRTVKSAVLTGGQSLPVFPNQQTF
jgi:hypothetical protein